MPALEITERAAAGPPRRLPSAWVRYAWPLGLVMIAHLPLLVVQANVLWSRPHYQFFPFVIAGAVAIAVSDVRRASVISPGSKGVALGLVGLSWLMLVAAALLYFPWLAEVAGLVTVLAAIYGIGGRKFTLVLLPAWAFLWIAAPPPFGFDTALTARLQRVVSAISDPVLDLFGVFHYMQGNVVVIAGRKMMIKEACSGIQSLLPVVSCVIFLLIWTRPTFFRGLVLLGSSVFWVVIGNAARVVSIVFMSAAWKIDLSTGWRHEALGLLSFAFILLLISSTDQLFHTIQLSVRVWATRLVEWIRVQRARRSQLDADVLEGPPPSSGFPSVPGAAVQPAVIVSPSVVPVETVAEPATPPERSRTWLGWWPVLGVYGLLGLFQLAIDGPFIAEDLFGRAQFVAKCSQLNEGTLLASWKAFRRKGFEAVERDTDDFQGEYSRIWTFDWRGKSVQVSVDYPFVGWHELTQCYKGQGWIPHRFNVRQGTDADDVARGPVIEVMMTGPGKEFGELFFALYNKRGGFQGARPQDRDYALGGRFLEKLRGDLSPLVGRGSRTSYQFQVLIRSEEPLSKVDLAEARGFFDEMRSLVWRAGPGGAR